MKLPGQLQAEFTLKGLWLAAIAAAMLIVIAIAAVQTARIEGFKVWPVSVEGWKPKAQRLDRDLTAVLRAQRAAEQAQRSVNAAAEQTYSTIAERIDDHAKDDLPRQLGAADRFIAAHRVRSEAAGGALGRAGAAAGDYHAQSAQGAGGAAELDDAGAAGLAAHADDLVAVPAEDVRICTVNTVKAEAGHALATQLEAASNGKPGSAR